MAHPKEDGRVVRYWRTDHHPGTKLFSQAFNPGDGALTWKDADNGELAGRMQLFTGTYAAHRNPRAHREPKGRSAELLREFLLLRKLCTSLLFEGAGLESRRKFKHCSAALAAEERFAPCADFP